ncbi:MAG: hypothetical protein E2O84_00670 [Bacteroidetes bacterium]|nr:MAG: hypothetical protein E2O84_00670 [Bacteroidota bacterium]
MIENTRLSLFLLIFVFLAGLQAGCDSAPGNVGSGLLDPQAGEPLSIQVETTVFEPQGTPDITGGSFSEGAKRALFGTVIDPAVGTIDASGHIDFFPTESVSDEFRNNSISMAELTLHIDYVYGDTLDGVTIQISDIIDSWDAVGVSADTVLTIGDPIMQMEIESNAQILRFELPSEWIQANDEILRSDNFSEVFHGFQLRTLSGNAVLGVSHAASTMKLAVPGDTSIFVMSKIVSTIEKTGDIDVPGSVLIQDGAAARVDVAFGLKLNPELDGIIHRTIFRISDSLPSLNTPGGFYRPQIERLYLALTFGDPQLRVLLAAATPAEDGSFTFVEGSIPEDELTFNETITGIILDILPDPMFEISVPVSESTINVLFVDDINSQKAPHVILTVTNIK